MKHLFDSGDRTYHVSDERLRAFRQLTPEHRLRWVDELMIFMRMAKVAREELRKFSGRSSI